MVRQSRPDGKVILGTTVTAEYQIETYRNTEIVKQNNKEKVIVQAMNYPKIVLDLDFLPAASESYNISPDPNDYILVSLPIVTADVPNRNLQAFALGELTYFDPTYGMMIYQTFNRKACHIDHINENPLEAKGVHADVNMQRVPKYDVWKINVLTLWDRTKDEKLVKDILNKKRTGYSMGAVVNAFVCSICGKVDNMDRTSCEHMKNKGSLWGEQRRLAYQLCHGACFFETSSVVDPADPTALSQDIFI